MTDYKVTIKETSLAQLTARDKLKLKDTTNAIKLDEVVEIGKGFEIEVADYVILDITNPASENGQYSVFMLIDTAGSKYITSSTSFAESFMDIFTEMAEETEPYSIEVYKVESKNYKGKHFITCSIV